MLCPLFSLLICLAERARGWKVQHFQTLIFRLEKGKKKNPMCSVVRFHQAAGWPDAKCILVVDSTCQLTSSCIDPLKCSSCFFLFLDTGDDEACHLHHVTRPSITPGRLHVNKRIPLSLAHLFQLVCRCAFQLWIIAYYIFACMHECKVVLAFIIHSLLLQGRHVRCSGRPVTCDTLPLSPDTTGPHDHYHVLHCLFLHHKWRFICLNREFPCNQPQINPGGSYQDIHVSVSRANKASLYSSRQKKALPKLFHPAPVSQR